MNQFTAPHLLERSAGSRGTLSGIRSLGAMAVADWPEGLEEVPTCPLQGVEVRQLFGLCISPAVARAAMKTAWVSEIELFVDLDALRVAISDLMLPVRPSLLRS